MIRVVFPGSFSLMWTFAAAALGVVLVAWVLFVWHAFRRHRPGEMALAALTIVTVGMWAMVWRLCLG